MYLLLFAEFDVDTMRWAVKTTKDIKFIRLKDSSGGISHLDDLAWPSAITWSNNALRLGFHTF